MSHPARGAWIEIGAKAQREDQVQRSHPARGAWIEMDATPGKMSDSAVAPRKGCVD